MERGVKQGDPISALLFIAVMQDLLGDLKIKWASANARRSGTQIGLQIDGSVLTNLRFADDVILVAQSRADIRKMLTHFATAAERYGLKLHPGKTKVMTWNAEAAGCRSVFIGASEVLVLDESSSEKYLGRKLSFIDHRAVELENRIKAGWAAFHKHKGELCSKFYALRDRVRLFDAVVSSAVLYGSATWTLTKCMEQHLRAAWRKMLRYVFRIHRKYNEGEEWVEYMRRSASQVEQLASNFELENWVCGSRRRKFRFAGRVARNTDERWS